MLFSFLGDSQLKKDGVHSRSLPSEGVNGTCPGTAFKRRDLDLGAVCIFILYDIYIYKYTHYILYIL